jgi:integrase
VAFSLKQRPGEQFYFATFRGRDGRRLERSTKETSQNRAREAAIQLIEEEYRPPEEKAASASWDEVFTRLRAAMTANNNRTTTVDDYLDTLTQLRRVYKEIVGEESVGPGDITTALAKRFKEEYGAGTFTRAKQKVPKVWTGRGRKPKPRPEPTGHSRRTDTLKSRLRKLRVIWGKWLIRELAVLSVNPWVGVSSPWVNKKKPRVLTAEEIVAFFSWLHARWGGWRLPILMLTVKAHVGCRILELCSIRSEQIREERIVFEADAVKGRKARIAVLPPDLFAEVQAQAGATFLWEGYPAQLKARAEELGKTMRKLRPDFSPERLKWWLQDEIADYCEAHPEVERFSAHSFRKHAMTEAWKLKIEPQRAAIAYGCNVRTMMAHYVGLDEEAVAEAVMREVQANQRFAGSGGQPQEVTGISGDLRGN